MDSVGETVGKAAGEAVAAVVAQQFKEQAVSTITGKHACTHLSPSLHGNNARCAGSHTGDCCVADSPLV